MKITRNIPLLTILREQINKSRREISREIKTSDCLYGKYERRDCLPNLATFQRLRDYIRKQGGKFDTDDLIDDFCKKKGEL